MQCSFKTVISKKLRKKQFYFRLEGHENSRFLIRIQIYGPADPDPDPYQNVTLLESLLSCRSLMIVERGWVSVYGVVISAYCYIFLFLMSCVFLLGGALLTGIAFRPQEVCVSSEPGGYKEMSSTFADQ
jgi:hypothetical protein